MADIKTRFVLEGEQQFRSAMNEAATSVKRLNSEQKLAKAQFRATGNEEKYAAEQARILKEKIAEQEKAVKAAQDALAQMTSQGVDKNSKAWQQWHGKLISAQTALANTQGEMNELSGTAQKTTKTAEKTASAVESIGKKVSYDAVIRGIGSITSGAEAAFRKVSQLAKSLWQMESDASVWADDLITQAAQYGMSTTELQQMQYASQLVDANVEDIVKAMDKVNKARGKSEGGLLDVGGLMVDVTGQTEMEAFWSVIEAMKQLPDETRRDAAAMELFGKSFRELNTLMADDAQERWNEAMREAPVVSEENVEALGEANDELVRMQAEWQKTKLELAASIAPAFKEIATAVGEIAKNIGEFAKSEEGQQAIADFTNALRWIAGNSGSVVTALGVIGTALAGLKVSETVLKFMQMKDGIKSLMGGGNGAGIGGAAGAGAGEAAQAAGSGIWQTVGGAVKASLSKASGPLMALTAAGMIGQGMWNQKQNYMLTNFGNSTTLNGWTYSQRMLAEQYYDNYRAEIFGNDPDAAGRSVQAYNALVESFGGVEDEALKLDQILENLNITEMWPEDLPITMFENMQSAADAAVNGLTSRMDAMYAAGQAMASSFAAGLSAGNGPRNQSITSNLYVGTMNMTNGNAKNLVGMIGNALARDRAAYGSP